MYLPKAKHFVVVLLVGLVLALSASQSQAFWGGCGWGGCGGGGWGWGGWGWGWGGWDCCDPCGGYYGWYGGCGWGCGRVVGIRRWYTPCWGCADVCCGVGYADPCCGAAVGAPVVGGAAPAPAPAPTPAPTPAPQRNGGSGTAPSLPPAPPAPNPPAPAGGQSTGLPATSGILTVYVPNDAKVTVNGLATKSTGSKREYISHNLKPGLTYKYRVTAQIVRDGKVLEDTQEVTLAAGHRDGLAFSFNPRLDEQLAQKP